MRTMTTLNGLAIDGITNALLYPSSMVVCSVDLAPPNQSTSSAPSATSVRP